MAEHWWRAYDGSIDHPKLLKLSDAMHRAWYTLQCIASANGGILPPTGDIALRLRVKPSKVAEWIAALVHAELLDNDAGVFAPHNWDTRQYKSDATDPTAPQRMKRYRENKRNERNATVTMIRPDTEQTTEQSRTEPRTDLEKRTGDFRQAIVQAYAEVRSTVLPETSRAGLWISQGFQEDICLAVIAGVLGKNPSIGSLSYFDKPIAEAHTKKAPPRKAINGPVALDWDAVLTSFKKFGHWSRDAGPDLTSPACRAPPEMLTKYGLTVTA